MTTRDIIEIAVLLVLLYLSSFFSSAETAFMCVNRLRLRTLSDEGNARARLALSLLEDQKQKMLTTILIGNNIVNLTASAMTGVMASRLGGSLAVSLATAMLTLLIIVLGEVTPKTAATIRAEQMTLRYVNIIFVLMVVLTPLVKIAEGLARVALFFMRINPKDAEELTTEEDIRTMLEVSHEDGQIEQDAKLMINNVFDLTDTEVHEIMVPRVDVTSVSADAGYDEVLALFEKEKYTRLPVYDDNPDQIVGVLNMKDVLLYKNSSEENETPDGAGFRVRDYMREALYTHEYKHSYELFLEMRKASVTMCIVLDEYGSMAGIITMEDILEEIVGEIHDEYDAEERDSAIRKIGERDYLVEASLRLDDLNDALGCELQSEDYDSIGGYLISLLDHIPEKGEAASDEEGNLIRAIAVDGNRIERVRLTLAEEPDQTEGTVPGVL